MWLAAPRASTRASSHPARRPPGPCRFRARRVPVRALTSSAYRPYPPSGVVGIYCSVDGGSSAFYPGASARVPVSGIGPHVIVCLAANTAIDPGGQPASSPTETFNLSIRQPTAVAISFLRYRAALLRGTPPRPRTGLRDRRRHIRPARRPASSGSAPRLVCTSGISSAPATRARSCAPTGSVSPCRSATAPLRAHARARSGWAVRRRRSQSQSHPALLPTDSARAASEGLACPIGER